MRPMKLYSDAGYGLKSPTTQPQYFLEKSNKKRTIAKMCILLDFKRQYA